MKKVVVFLAEGFEEVEALTVVDLLRRGNIEVDTISIKGNEFVTGRTNITVMADYNIDEKEMCEYDALVLPGGMPGTKNLMENKIICDTILKFNDETKLISAICAAPTVCGKLGILEGKKACCYPGFEGELLGAKVSSDNVCVDKNVITSKGIGTAIEFALSIIEYLEGKSISERVRENIIYK